MSHQKDFEKWNKQKVETEAYVNKKAFKERQLWMISMGENIGHEQCGKGGDFLRPVIVFKKFSKDLFLGIPLTTTIRRARFYCNFPFHGSESSAILSQIRLYDAKRLRYKKGMISLGDYSRVKNKLIALLQ